MPNHIEALKPIDQWRAPWETEGGTDAEIDKPKLKRYIYGLVSDKAKAQDSLDEAVEARKTAEAERDTAKEEAEKASPDEANKKIARLEEKVKNLTTERDSLVAAKEQADLRSEVLAGLDPKYAKYVHGETREELEKSLEEVKADFGLAEGPDDADDDDDDDDDDDFVGRTRPRSRLRSVNDPDAGRDAGSNVDYEKIASEIIGGGLFG